MPDHNKASARLVFFLNRVVYRQAALQSDVGSLAQKLDAEVQDLQAKLRDTARSAADQAMQLRRDQT